jgi:2-polyprenyl-3-methyl-5-hydroxy-6-metoxy-1,4-benzoquinol methylase
VVDGHLRRQTFAYYDQRAGEYEEAYTLGTGTSSIQTPGIFTTESRLLASVVERHVQGRIIDLACGTGFWLPSYAARCSHLTLFDQSERMLHECRKKVAQHGLADRCDVQQGDFFEHRFAEASYDWALVGFFLSHVEEVQEPQVFAALKQMLVPSGRFLLLDSAWSPERAKTNAKAERQERRTNDGARFEIYKRYFDEEDVREWGRRYQVPLEVAFIGSAFVAVVGRL